MTRSSDALEDVRGSLVKIEAYTARGREVFFADTMVQDAVIRNFEIVGEALKKVNQAVLNAEPTIDWDGFKGFRDVLIHGYMHIDLDIVWATVEQDVPSLKAAVERLLTTGSPST